MPSIKLTQKQVNSIPYAEKGQQFYWDSTLPGFGVKVGISSKTFIVQREVNGKVKRRKIGDTKIWSLEVARQAAREQLIQMSKGVDPLEEKRRKALTGKTFEAAYQEFIAVKAQLVKPRTLRNYEDYFKNHLQVIRPRPFREITAAELTDLHNNISQKSGSFAAKHTISLIGAIYNFHAMDDESIRNPANVLKRRKVLQPMKRRETFIDSTDLPKWYKAVLNLNNSTIRDAYLLFLFTGLRKMELLTLKWADVDFDKRLVTIRDTKNKTDFLLPMSKRVYDILNTRQKFKGDSKWVLTGEGKEGHLVEPKRSGHIVTEKSGVKFGIHDLRRTYATIAESVAPNAYSVKRLLNHKTGDVTSGYLQTDMQTFRKVVELVAEEIEKIIQNV